MSPHSGIHIDEELNIVAESPKTVAGYSDRTFAVGRNDHELAVVFEMLLNNSA